MPLSKSQLLALNQTNFPDNTQQLISPEDLRDFNDEMVASMQLTQSMSAYAVLSGGNAFIGSQSIEGNVSIDKSYALNTNGVFWNSNVVGYTNLEIVNSSVSGNLDLAAKNGRVRVSSSLDIINGTFTASLQNGFTFVGNGSGKTIAVSTSSFASNINTGSFVTTSSFNAYTSSNDTKWNTLGGQTGSFVTSGITGSSLVTASFSGNTLTFTKGDSSTFGVVIPDVSGSGPTDISSLNAFTQSQDTKNTTLGIYTASVDTQFVAVGTSTSSLNSATASLFTSASLALVTASFSGNTLTFTKGNNTTFGVTIPDISGSTIPAGTISGSSQITALGFVSSSVTGSSLVTGSVSGNVLTFTKGDATQFSLTVATGSGGGSTDTGSLMVTGSVNVNVLTFTKGDGSTFDLTVAASGSAPAGTVSSSQQILNYNIFATTGSNDFVGVQSFSGSAENANAVNLIGSTKMTLGGTTMPFNETAFFSMVAGDGGNNAGLLQYQVSNGGVRFLCGDAPSGSTQTVGQSPITFDNQTRSGSISFTNSGNTGDITLQNNTGSINLTATQGNVTIQSTLRIKQKDGGNTIQVSNSSGSLIFAPGSFTTSSLHLSQSNASSTINWVFKNNNTAGDTIISGSNNIFTNPATPTTGYKRYIGGANNLYLNNSNGITSQITASATSVSGARPSMNNNIFAGTGNFSINQAVNGGTLTLNNNIIGGTGTTTINALGFTGSLSVSSNFNNNGTITANAASASVTEITSGLSGSGGFNVNNNGIFGGTITATSPRTLLTSVTQNINGNILAQGAITVTNISSSAVVSATSNIGGGSFTYLNAGAAGLGLHTTAGAMNANIGGMVLIASASAIQASNNISPAGMSVVNRAFSGSLGLGAMGFNNNQTQGGGNTYTATGSFGGTISNITGPVMQANGIFGASNTIFTNVEGRGNYVDVRNNLIGGTFLILTGSNNLATTGSGGGYFGRFNANDGLRNGTGENILVVGTGTSEANRKTGFLIDSGSNTFVEGSLNVSGSTAFTGSISIAPTFQAKFATGSNQQAGTAVLDGANPGTIVVSNSLVTANSIIMLTKQTLTNAHMVGVSSKGAGTFTITSNGNGDGDTVGWFIINNS